MNQSSNYNFNLPEGTDLVNLLTQLIPNWNSLDTILKGVENQAFTNCTEVTSLGVHAISRTNADGKILKWIATSNFTAGETFTVDGNVVAASTPAGATLATGAYVTGAVIIAALNSAESAMTIFVSGTNVATDSEKLGGELPAYYAKQSDMNTAQINISDLDNLMGNTSISAIGDGTVTGAVSAINSALGATKIIPIANQNISWSAYQATQTLDLSSYGVTPTNFIGGIVANLTGSGGSYYISKVNGSLTLVQTNPNNTGTYSTTVNYLIFVAA